MSWLDTLEQIRERDFSKAKGTDRDKAARDVVNMCSYACAVVSVSPIPFSDAVLMLPIQTAMVMTVGHIYGRKLTQADAKDLLLELGALVGVSFLARQGIKALLPVVGALLTIPAAFAANWAIGRVSMDYFRAGGLSKEKMKEAYEQAKREAGSIFSMANFSAFKKKNEDAINAVAEDDEAEEEEEAAPPPAKKKPVAKKKPAAKKAAAPKAAPVTAGSILEGKVAEALKSRRDVANAIPGLVHVDLKGKGGGKWTIDPSSTALPVSEGLRGKPHLTVRGDAKAFTEVATGEREATGAVMGGDLEVEPMDLELVGKVASLFTS
jgi:uncharacterized protein (DUF697 family)